MGTAWHQHQAEVHDPARVHGLVFRMVVMTCLVAVAGLFGLIQVLFSKRDPAAGWIWIIGSIVLGTVTVQIIRWGKRSLSQSDAMTRLKQ